MPRQSPRTALLVFLATALACSEGTAPGSLGQLRLRPVFAPGEEPGTLGISPSEIRVVLRRADGVIVADTALPYVPDEKTSWLIDLATPPENVDVSAELGQGTAIMYAGAGQVSLPAGIGSSSTEHDLPVRYLGGATFSVDVSPGNATLPSPGDTRQFTAMARDPGGKPLIGFSFVWVSSRPEVATVNASGLVTAVARGQSTIFATSGGVVGSALVTVQDPRPVSIVVTPDSAMILLGGSITFTASVRDALDNVVAGVVPSWSSTRIDVATVSESGMATAVGAGRAIVVATFGGLADSAIVTVPESGPGFGSIIVTPSAATLTALGNGQLFSAVAVTAQGAIIPGVIFQWSSSNTSVATVNSSGMATATGAGVTAITATANGMTGGASLTVSLGPGPPVRLVALPPVATLTALGATLQYTAVAFDAGGRIVPVPVSWSSSNPAVAPITPFGIASAVSNGTVTISATAGSLRGDASLTVNQVVHSVSINPVSAQIVSGNSTSFTAVARDANGHVVPGAVFTWSTTDPAIATVGVTGIATGVSGGNTLVRASTGGVSGDAQLSVVVVGSVQILGDEEQHVLVGSTRQFTAVVRDPAGNVVNDVPVTWSVEDPTIASITTTGLVVGSQTGITRVRALAGSVFGEVWLVVRPSQNVLSVK
jgi:uncharacterized protein YjdB